MAQYKTTVDVDMKPVGYGVHKDKTIRKFLDVLHK